jgi:RHS repeat-associated protein
LIDLTYSYNNRGLLSAKYDKYIGKIGEGLREDYTYDNLNRLSEVQVTSSLLANNQKLLNYSYDSSGNLLKKSDLSITYKSDKPHQIDRVNGIIYQYDENGNLLKDDRHTFEYDPLDKVKSITQNGKTIKFDYSSSQARYQKIYNNGIGYKHYIGKLYEKIRDDYTIEDKEEKNYIYFNNSLIAIKSRDVALKPKESVTLFVHQDNINNIIAITDEDNNIIDRRSYTPFGEIRSIAYNEELKNIPTLIERLKNSTDRSFTGHEYIEDTDIIHMNGRVYDTITSRFTSADPYIQDSYNLQSYNRYSYVMNNPLNLTDPSGYFFSGWGHFYHKHRDEIKQGVAIAAAVVTTALTGGGAAPAWAGFFGSTTAGVIASGALAGAASGAIMTGTVDGALQGALWGGISAGVAFGVAEGAAALTNVSSEAAHSATFFSGNTKTAFVKALSHGLSRTAISELRYGTTKGAFLSGFVSSGFSVGGGNGYKGAFAMAIVGGTVSELGGGKFANGAMGSAFQYMFNDLMIENTNAASGLHRRLVVYNKDGKRLYGISFGVKAGESIIGGEGGVYEDYQDSSTKIVGVLHTTGAEDLRIISYMQSQVGQSDTYNVIFNNCRDYSSNQFEYIGERILGR